MPTSSPQPTIVHRLIPADGLDQRAHQRRNYRGPDYSVGTAADNVAVSKVEVSIDGGVWNTATGTTSWTFLLNSQNQLNGTHTIAARSIDTSSNTSSVASVTVRFFNVPGAYLARISAGNPNNVTDCVANVWSRISVHRRLVRLFRRFHRLPRQHHLQRLRECLSAIPTRTLRKLQLPFDCPAGIYETTLLEAENWTNVPMAASSNVSSRASKC